MASTPAVTHAGARWRPARWTRVIAGGCVVALLAGCGARGATDPVPRSCLPGFSVVGTTCVQFAERSVERVATPWSDAGTPVTLEMVVYRPMQGGPYPTIIFHHGSTGNGDNPALFTLTYTSEAVAKAFVDRGWMVLFPQRRGRGASGGRYDEGFEPDRSRYSCRAAYARPGLEHALEDATVIAAAVRVRSDVDTARLLVGGVSRGGILAMAHAARAPQYYRGVVNFVGGWIGEGCVDAVTVNRSTFADAAVSGRPSLWLYAENDPFYSVAHSRANFDAFTAAGGLGTFRVYRRANASASGHGVTNEPQLWLAELQSFLSAVAP